MPDFFDRLVARHTPDAGGALRARPRLPGPFERVDTAEPPVQPPLLDVERSAPPAPPPAVRTTAATPPNVAAHSPRPAHLLAVEAPLAVREATSAPLGALVVAAVRPPPPAPVSVAGQPATGPAPGATRPQSPAEDEPTGRDVTVRSPGTAAPRSPSPVVVPVIARPSGRPATSVVHQPTDRPGRPERVVHVSIGRLEVRAERRRPDTSRESGGTGRSGRAAPVLTLAKYLAGEEAQR